MAGIKALRKIQLGRETTKGTAVAATARWRGIGTIKDERVTMFPEEDIGILSGSDRTYVPQYGASLSMESVPATFEQIEHVLEAGVKTVAGVADGAGSGYIYDRLMPTTTGNTTKTYTIEGGDNEQAEETEYAFVKSFALSGVAKEAWMISSEWTGRQVTKCTFTAAGSAAVPTVEEMLFGKTKLYIDAISGTIGTTQISSTLLSATVNVQTGIREVYSADGNLYFTFTKQVAPEVLLNVTFEHNSTSIAQKDIWIAETAKLLQLKCEGSAFTTAGTTYTYKSFLINLPGKWESFDKIGEQDGNDIIAGVFRGRYNSTADLAPQFITVNDLASVP